MAVEAKIYGAGSVGNHHAYACRRAGWNVTVVDTDPAALERMAKDIYPKRYGGWDKTIQLYSPQSAPQKQYDVVFIGTPPDTHLAIAMYVLKNEQPRVLQIEKPLCATTLEGLKEFLKETARHPATAIIVGYNHILADNTVKIEEYLREKRFGKLQYMTCAFRSHWQNILDAHPWLSGPEDTYLGHWKRGGGASGEHSHGLNLWQHFAHVAEAGRIVKVLALFDYIKDSKADYDSSCFLHVQTETGLEGRIIQDVITLPKKKFATLHFAEGIIEWHNDVTKTTDQVIEKSKGQEIVLEMIKTRQDEFFKETLHIQDILEGKIRVEDSPIRLERAVETMAVLAAAHCSDNDWQSCDIRHELYRV